MNNLQDFALNYLATILPGFTWQNGMAGITKSGLPFIMTDPDAMSVPPWEGASLDLSHPANTGFILRLLWELDPYSAIESGIVEFPLDDNTWEIREVGESENINHAMVKALCAAHKIVL